MFCSPYHLGRKGLLPENGDEKGDSDQYLVRAYNAKLIMKLSQEGIAQTALFYFFRCKRARLSF
jgi:hypothetical protein